MVLVSHLDKSTLLLRIACRILDTSFYPGYSPSLKAMLDATMSHEFFLISHHYQYILIMCGFILNPNFLFL